MKIKMISLIILILAVSIIFNIISIIPAQEQIYPGKVTLCKNSINYGQVPKRHRVVYEKTILALVQFKRPTFNKNEANDVGAAFAAIFPCGMEPKWFKFFQKRIWQTSKNQVRLEQVDNPMEVFGFQIKTPQVAYLRLKSEKKTAIFIWMPFEPFISQPRDENKPRYEK